MAVAYNYYDTSTKSFRHVGLLQHYHELLKDIIIAQDSEETALGIAKNVTSHFSDPDTLVVDQINSGTVFRDGIARYFWLMSKDGGVIDIGSLGTGFMVTNGHMFTLSSFTITKGGGINDFADYNQYAYIQKIDNTRKTSGRCPYCRSLRSESIFHPGTCVNCGGSL